MTALLEPLKAPVEAGRARLRGLPRPAVKRVGSVWFVVMLLGVLAAGMGGLLVLNTEIQDQAFTVNELAYDAKTGADQQAKLQADVERAASTTRLIDRAAKLGMVPASGVGYLYLADGHVDGKPKPITGAELPYYRTGPQVEADAKAKAEADAKAKAEADAKAKADADAKAKADEEAKHPGAAASPSASAGPSAPAGKQPQPTPAAGRP